MPYHDEEVILDRPVHIEFSCYPSNLLIRDVDRDYLWGIIICLKV